MSGPVFFKIAWDLLSPKLPSDCPQAFEPEGGLPVVKGMLAQTQGGSSQAVYARRWCVCYLYAALARIEDLEKTCAGPDAIRVQEALPEAIRKLPVDLQVSWIKDVVAHAGLAGGKGKKGFGAIVQEVIDESVTKQLHDALPASVRTLPLEGQVLWLKNAITLANNADLPTPANLTSAAVEDSAALVKAEAHIKKLEGILDGLTPGLKRIQTILMDTAKIHVGDDYSITDKVKLLAQGVNAMAVHLTVSEKELAKGSTVRTAKDEAYGEMAAMLDNIEKATRELEADTAILEAPLDERVVGYLKELEDLRSRKVIETPITTFQGIGGAEPVIKELPGVAREVVAAPAEFPLLLKNEIRQLRIQLARTLSTSKVYYTGWKRRSEGPSPEGMAKLAMLLGKAESLGIVVPMNATNGGLATDAEIVDAAISLMYNVCKVAQMATPAPQDTQVQELTRTRDDYRTQIQDLETGMKALTTEREDLWAILPKELQGGKSDSDLCAAVCAYQGNLETKISDLGGELARAKADLAGIRASDDQGRGPLKIAGESLMLKSFEIDSNMGRLPSFMEFMSTERAPVLCLGDANGIPAPLCSRYVREDLADRAILMASPVPLDPIRQMAKDLLDSALAPKDLGGPRGVVALKHKDQEVTYDDFDYGVVTHLENLTPGIQSQEMEGFDFHGKRSKVIVLVAWTGKHPSGWDLGPLTVERPVVFRPGKTPSGKQGGLFKQRAPK